MTTTRFTAQQHDGVQATMVPWVEPCRDVLQLNAQESAVVRAIANLLDKVDDDHPAYPHLTTALRAAEDHWQDTRDAWETCMLEQAYPDPTA
jgi:hypothetical protein